MLIEGCKHELEITVPAEEIARETERVVAEIQKKARMPGFRPGKVPANLIKSRFAFEVRQDVLESLVPKYFHKRVQEDELNIVGTPNIKDVHFEDGEPLRFKAEFEIAPQIELKDYRGVLVHYHEPEVTDEDVQKRLEDLREQKAQYVNIDPRPVVEGDYAVVSLQSLSGLKEPIQQPSLTMHVGDKEQLPEFNEALLGMVPDEEKEFEVQYPEEYGQENLAGKTVKFRMTLKVIRMKELPDLNDEFAKDLGDFETLDSLREAVRKTIFREKEVAAQQKAKEEAVDRLIDTHDFPVPEAYVERQIESEAEAQFRRMTGGQNIDIKKLKESIDWDGFTSQMRPKALREVKASLLIDRLAEVEKIYATNDEVDREVQRFARQEREPVAAVRKKLEKSGAIGRIAHRIRADKAVSFLFEHARKEA